MAYVIVPLKTKGDGKPLACSDWFPLLEIFNVKISRLSEKKVAKMYGKIELDYSYGIWKLYHREEADAETVSLPGDITLNHPPVAVQALYRFYISFALKGAFEELRDEEDFVSWNSDYGTPNKLMIEEFKGQNCSLTISYIVYESAVVADVELLLLACDNRKYDGCIFGDITASFTKMSYGPEMDFDSSSTTPYTNIEGLKNVLFSKQPHDRVYIMPKDNRFKIPLSKSVICIPIELALDIHVDLFSLPGVEIGSGVVRCFPDSRGEHVGMIPGTKGRSIQVKVTIWRHPQHPRTAEDKKLYRSGQKPCF